MLLIPSRLFFLLFFTPNKCSGYLETVASEVILKSNKHYSCFINQAMIHFPKNSINASKKRIGSCPALVSSVDTVSTGRGKGSGSVAAPKGSYSATVVTESYPVHHLSDADTQLAAPQVVLHPSLDEIQVCSDRSAQVVHTGLFLTGCMRGIDDFDHKLRHFEDADSDSAIGLTTLFAALVDSGVYYI